MKDKLNTIYELASKDIENAKTSTDLEEIKLKYLSRKGEFNSIKKGLKDLSIEDKKIVGALANEITQKLEDALAEKSSVFYRQELEQKLQNEKLDITLSGKYVSRGKVHPITATTNEIVSILQSLGFSLVPTEFAPEVETEYYNFDMLNVPKNHPARDVQDTFFTKLASNTVLRSQTSNAQIRTMENMTPPIKVIAPGRVYRNETVNARKNNFFHQFEGLYVD